VPAHGSEQEFVAALASVLEELHLSLPEQAREKLVEHYRLLSQWNRRMSLTTLSDPREIVKRHFGESLFLARELPIGVQTVLDVGSGPGFPGLPLAAWCADLQVTLLESVQRKAVFLKEVSRSWPNVNVLNERLEGLAGHWDASVMRAVALDALPHLARLSQNVAVLTGQEGAEQAYASPLYTWARPQKVPWGDRRFLLQGSRRHP
jgi:16S rRNA (guanine527-N7)-methyltransferase